MVSVDARRWGEWATRDMDAQGGETSEVRLGRQNRAPLKLWSRLLFSTSPSICTPEQDQTGQDKPRIHKTTMSQKRKHSSVADLEAANPTSAKKHRPFKPRKPRTDDDERSTSANALKSRIRDLKRLLAHVENVPKHKMSAGARIERERELEASEHQLAEMTARARESEYRKKMIGKYHQVRFFGEFLPRITGLRARGANSRRPPEGYAHTQAAQEGALDA